ncbi:MAG TPA: glyoxalase superfamily protein [Candidatus Limnocylindrales bacterium]|nr:glyoxalase superfamily protein [Candidatus Limnocylindrales bacterium]
MDFKLELVVVPVSDVDRAKAFYVDKMGFNVDVDHRASDTFRVVQLTPPGSACSITIGTGVTKVAPGTYQGLHLVVTDIEGARAWLVERGVDAGQPFHFGPEGQMPGLAPKRGDYETFVSISDPDGNGWLVQEVGHQAR